MIESSRHMNNNNKEKTNPKTHICREEKRKMKLKTKLGRRHNGDHDDKTATTTMLVYAHVRFHCTIYPEPNHTHFSSFLSNNLVDLFSLSHSGFVFCSPFSHFFRSIGIVFPVSIFLPLSLSLSLVSMLFFPYFFARAIA